MSVITVSESKRAETVPPHREPSVEDLVRLLERRPPSELAELTLCSCGECDRTVERRLFDLFANDDIVFQTALRPGKSRTEALFELRDTLMRLREVRAMLADRTLSRRSILAGVNQRAAKAAWFSCFPASAQRRPQCGVAA